MDLRVSAHPVDDAAAAIGRRLTAAVRQRGSAALALSGGSTAPPMITALIARSVPWEAVTVWQVDERIAPDGDPARNANHLAPLPCRVLLMPVTVRDLTAGARRYAAGLPDRFDVVHLGVGDDGHTASWPPGDVDVLRSPRDVDLVPEFNGRRRMTLTPRPVNAARARLVLAVGASKRPAIERWVGGDRSVPVSAVRRSGTIVVLDREAAPGGEH